MNMTYNSIIKDKVYQTKIPSGSHWSMVIRRGTQLTIKDLEGAANVGMIFFNPTHI